MARKTYDITNVVAAFLSGHYESTDPSRAQLMEEMRGHLGLAANLLARPIQLLAAEVAAHCVEQPGCTPEMTVRIGIQYGLVLGILAEKDRAEREKLRIIQ